MIKGLYETHLFVENLEVSINFYQKLPGLQLCHREPGRQAAFFWIGEPRSAMLGLWQKPGSEIDKRHFALRCDADDIRYKAADFLKLRNIKPYNFLKDGTENPLVFAWMPAISIYFDDPDGHELEFIGILNGKARPEAGVLSYEKWIMLKEYE